LVCRFIKEEPGVKAMFVVPKKKFRKANDRNKLKRRMREAYRLQKAELYKQTAPAGINLAFIYTGTKAEEYEPIYKAVAKLLNNLTKENSANATKEAK
jgi:ribonuclease P protein component